MTADRLRLPAQMSARPKAVLPMTATRHAALTSSIERETKLRVDERFRLPKLPGRPLPPRVLTSTYYDTPDHRLARTGITLRHRIERRKELWQLKLPSQEGRRELEIAGGPEAAPAALLDLLAAHLRGTAVAPVATVRTLRRGVRVRGAKGPVADVVLDTVSVLEHGRVARRFREIEIERLDGDESLVAHIERLLRTAGAGDHDGRPKLFQALDLPARPDAPPPADAPVADHLTAMLGRQVTTLLAHDPGTRLGGDTEDLHQMRVAVRRLRTILRVAQPLLDPEWTGPLRAELAWLGEALGPARDLDVQAAYFRQEAATLKSHDRRPLERFIEHLRREREAAQQALVHALHSPRYTKLIVALLEGAETPPVVASPATLEGIAADTFKKLKKSLRRLDRAPTDAELHRVRILTKRARYAAELARASRGKPAARFAEEAKALQELLGSHQDAVQAEEHIRAFVARTTGVRAAFVAGRMVERQRQRRNDARATLEAQWEKLKRRGKKAWG